MEAVLVTLWATAALAALALAVHHLAAPHASSGGLGLVAVAGWVLVPPVAALGFAAAAAAARTRGRVAQTLDATAAVCLAGPAVVLLAAARPPAALINAVRALNHRRRRRRPRGGPDSDLG